jgi:multidrug resistance efflux pump
LAEEGYREAEKRVRVSRAQLDQALAQKNHRQAVGTMEQETELGRRDKELAEARSILAVLEAGSRPEEIEAQQAQLSRLQEEVAYLEGLKTRLQITSPVGGLVTTPRLRDKIGQYFKEGDFICQIEDPALLEAEISLAEQEAALVRPGLPVELKARALPLETFRGRVERIAPRTHHTDGTEATTPTAGKADGQGLVIVYCRVLEGSDDLRPGMSGQARVLCGQAPISEILLHRALRFLRTEFWW